MPQFVVQISGVFSFSETHWICLAKDAHHTPLVNRNEQTQKEIVINKQIRLNLIYTGGAHFKKYFNATKQGLLKYILQENTISVYLLNFTCNSVFILVN